MKKEIPYRIDKSKLSSSLSIWNSFIKKKIHLIACGGTALTLMDLKESTRDVDFIIPEENEYRYLVKVLMSLGYKNTSGTGWEKNKGFKFDLFVGKTIFTTELLESPLEEGNNILYKEYSYLYIGILNYYDLIISKLFRYTPVDESDCLCLYKAKYNEINYEKLKKRFLETSSYSAFDEQNKNNLKYFERTLKQEGLKI